MNLNKLDSILKKNQGIKDFKVFDPDTEWNLFLETIENQDSERIHPLTKKNKTRFPILYIVRAIAAIVVLVLVFLVVLREPKNTRASFTAVLNQSIVTLSDGSVITMTKGSTIDYPLTLSGQNERMILLNGTATFDVRKNILPFNVYSRDIKVEVIGTKFIVSSISDTSFIENLEGVVKVSEVKNPENNVTLTKGDKFLYVSGTFKDLNYEEPSQNNIDNQNALKVKQNQEKHQETKKVIGSVYKLGSVLKDYLVKRNKKLVKIDKKFKYDSEQRVRLNLTGNYTEVINSLKTQGIIDTKPGDCQNCIIIIAPGSKK